MAAPKKFSSILTMPQPKKHSVRYDKNDDDVSAVCTSVYLNKDMIAELGNPSNVKITIEAA